MRRAILCLIVLGAAAPAFAQARDPLPVFALDARGAFVLLKQDSVTASTVGITVGDLATRGLGLVAGAHVYPLRGQKMALGIGGELFFARGAKQRLDAEDLPLGPRG